MGVCMVSTLPYADIHAALRAHFPSKGEVGFVDFFPSVGSIAGGLLYATVFCPPLQEIEGLIFHDLDVFNGGDLATEYEVNSQKIVQDWLDHFAGDTEDAQYMMNHLHPWRMLGYDTVEWLDNEEELFAQAVAACWKVWLPAQYPDREFVVVVTGPEDSDDVDDAEEDENALEEDDIAVSFYEPQRTVTSQAGTSAPSLS